MSSDVYIDTEDDVIRLGHLGTLSCFLLDLKTWVDLLSGAFPVINEHVIAAIPAAVIYFNQVNAKHVAETTAEYRLALYSYYDPDWHDVLEPDQIRAFLVEHQGERWRVRVD
jgi:hypothetical protein